MKKIAALYKNKKNILSKASASLADQILLSLLNFAVGLMFIKYATKQEYAAYAQVYALVFLTTTVQSGLINSPALTLLPQQPKDNRGKVAGSFFALQAGLSILFATIIGLITFLMPSALSFNASTSLFAMAMALTIWIVWLRDFVRNQLYIAFKVVDCFILDLIYFVFCIALFYVLIKLDYLTASFVLLAMFFAAILSTFPWLFKAGIDFHFNKLEIKNTFNHAWQLAKWALPGGFLSWAFGNGYVLIAAYTIGSVATAEIVAARLFVAPLGMIYLAWSNVFRPRASHWIAHGENSKVKRASYAALAAIAVGVAVYCILLILTYPYLETHILTKKYTGLSKDIVLWTAFFFASGLANIGTGVLQALGHYKETFYASLVGCVASIPLMFILGLSQGKIGVLLGLTIGEFFAAGWLILAMRKGLTHKADIEKSI